LQTQALLVELLAVGVAAGLDRKAREETAAEIYRQFVPPPLANRLARGDRGLLEELRNGVQREVTVLFCDVRDYSKIMSRHRNNPDVNRWSARVLEEVFDCVQEQAGEVLKDEGDGVMAIWGSQGDQADHAQRGARAALALLAALGPINREWEPRLGLPTRMGVGLNSGPAEVRLVASRGILRYGVSDHTLNLAHRVEGATKYLRVPLLISAATRAALAGQLSVRRIRKVRAVGPEDAFDVYELLPPGATAGCTRSTSRPWRRSRRGRGPPSPGRRL
jgi:adenylate cyclase